MLSIFLCWGGLAWFVFMLVIFWGCGFLLQVSISWNTALNPSEIDPKQLCRVCSARCMLAKPVCRWLSIPSDIGGRREWF